MLGEPASPNATRPLVRWIAWFILLFIAPVVMLAMAEFGLRLAGYGYPTSFFVAGLRPQTLISNRQFGWRFFPRRIARTPLPLLINLSERSSKRIVVLGESAAMGFPDPMFAFAHQLQVMSPGSAVEVINTSMTAINSNGIRDIAEECGRLRPNLIVIYMGNNEVVGPSGPALMLRHFRLGQWLTPQRNDLSQWRGMEMFLDRQMEADDPRLQAIYGNFRNNLMRICRDALAASERVVLSTVAVNLKDNPPFAGVRAAEAFRSGDFARARDLDTLRFRADSRVNAIIREVAAAYPTIRLIDAEKLIPPDGSSFYEHVHLRPGANAKLAAAIVGPDAQPGFEPTAWDAHRMVRDIADMMNRPPFRGASVHHAELEGLRSRVNLDEAERTYRAWSQRFPNDVLIGERYAELLAEAGRHKEAAAQWRVLIGVIPEVPNWHTGLAESLLYLGKLNEAADSYGGALRIDPEFIAAHIGLGTVQFSLGKEAEAEVRFRAALAIDPSSPQANNNLAGILVRRNQLDLAAVHFAEAVRAKPDFANAQYSFAATLSRLGRIPEAMEHYRAALIANPEFPAAHYDLGLLLAEKGSYAEAIGHYQEALRLDPTHADAENNWGTALARQGRLKEAMPHFEAALKLQPGHAQAKKNLESARGVR